MAPLPLVQLMAPKSHVQHLNAIPLLPIVWQPSPRQTPRSNSLPLLAPKPPTQLLLTPHPMTRPRTLHRNPRLLLLPNRMAKTRVPVDGSSQTYTVQCTARRKMQVDPPRRSRYCRALFPTNSLYPILHSRPSTECTTSTTTRTTHTLLHRHYSSVAAIPILRMLDRKDRKDQLVPLPKR